MRFFTLQALAAMGFSAHAPAQAQALASVEFNEQFLGAGGAEKVDISRFNKGQSILPGMYRADTYVNDTWKGKFEIEIRESATRAMQACMSADLLDRLNVDRRKLSPEASALLEAGDGRCLSLAELIPNARADFDGGEQRLDVSVPQIAMLSQARGYIDPKYWDDGIPGVSLQYNANAFHSASGGASTDTQYLGVNVGVNAGPWRFRHQGNLTHGNSSGTHYQSVQTYVQRAFKGIDSELLVGDSFTDGALFDSFGMRGASLATDDRMVPESQRGYAPVVHGIADSNAKVQIRQNGNIIYDTTVAPGAFEITDLYPTGYGGDLQVIVTEADGSVHTSTVPYAAAVNSLRPGVTRYRASIGEYRDPTVRIHPFVSQFTIQHGLSNLLTAYGGVTIGDRYFAGLLGTALNTKIGAFGVDVTQSSASLQGVGTRNGTSIRMSYSRLFEPTDTNLAIAAYRYSTGGFFSFPDAVSYRQLYEQNQLGMMSARQKARLQFTLNQNLGQDGRFGALYAVGSVTTYWNRSARDTQYQIGYNNTWKRVTYGASIVRQYLVDSQRWDNQFMLTASIPLSWGSHYAQSTTRFQHDTGSGGSSIQQSVTGSLGSDNTLSYGVNATYADGGATGESSTSAGGNVGYMSPFALVAANASVGRNYSQYGAGVSGGVVAWRDGVAFTPNMGDTVAIVEAKDAAGARLTNGSGLRVDPWGHAIVSGVQPYSNNDVEIDPKGLPLNIQLKSTVQRTAPTAGAIVKVQFDTENTGQSALIRITKPDGKPVPFGAVVTDEANEMVGTVSQGSRLIATGLKSDHGRLDVKWGDGGDQQCTLSYELPPELPKSATYSLRMAQAACLPSAQAQ